jgi:hypothetical protein
VPNKRLFDYDSLVSSPPAVKAALGRADADSHADQPAPVASDPGSPADPPRPCHGVNERSPAFPHRVRVPIHMKSSGSGAGYRRGVPSRVQRTASRRFWGMVHPAGYAGGWSHTARPDPGWSVQRTLQTPDTVVRTADPTNTRHRGPHSGPYKHRIPWSAQRTLQTPHTVVRTADPTNTTHRGPHGGPYKHQTPWSAQRTLQTPDTVVRGAGATDTRRAEQGRCRRATARCPRRRG